MANITKSPAVSNYSKVPVSNVKSTQKSQPVTHVYGKGEVHNTPDHRSGNERFIIDLFYSNAHNLKASFIRLSEHDSNDQTMESYYKQHEEEVISGALDLIEAIHLLFDKARQCDRMYGTHFTFVVESITNDFEERLEAIGLTHTKYQFKLNRTLFFKTLCDQPDKFKFLFKLPDGFMELQSRVYLKIQSILASDRIEGSIIDLRA